jgi:hypothetical protein
LCCNIVDEWLAFVALCTMALEVERMMVWALARTCVLRPRATRSSAIVERTVVVVAPSRRTAIIIIITASQPATGVHVSDPLVAVLDKVRNPESDVRLSTLFTMFGIISCSGWAHGATPGCWLEFWYSVTLLGVGAS